MTARKARPPLVLTPPQWAALAGMFQRGVFETETEMDDNDAALRAEQRRTIKAAEAAWTAIQASVHVPGWEKWHAEQQRKATR